MISIPHSPWSDTADQLIVDLQTDVTTGLTETEIKQRLKTYGESVFESSSKNSPLAIFFKQFTSPLIIILCVAVVITALLGEWLDTAIIAFAVLVNAVLGFIQEYKAEQAISNLRSYITHRTRVIRDGHELEIDPRLLVPGAYYKRLTYNCRCKNS